MATTGNPYRRSIVVSEETVAGTTDATPTGYRLRCTSITERRSQDLIDIGAYRGDRRQGEPIPDTIDVGLSITVPVYPDEFGWWLKWGIGAPATTGSGTFTHIYKAGYSGADDGDIPGGLSIEVQYPDLDTPQYMMYLGCRVNTLSFSYNPSGGLFANIDLLARSASISGTPQDGTPTAYTSSPINQEDVTSVKEGGSTNAICRGGEFRVNNQIDGSVYYVGGLLKRGALPTGQVAVDGTTTFDFQDSTLIGKGTAGTESALEII